MTTEAALKLRWSYSGTLLLAYVGLFHLWLLLDPLWVAASTLVSCALLIWLFSLRLGDHYFLNFWDAVIHATVILDLILEGLVVRLHEGYSFYGCAAGFAFLIVGYRFWLTTLKSRALTGH